MIEQKILEREIRKKGITFENTLYELEVFPDSGTVDIIEEDNDEFKLDPICKFVVLPKQCQFNPG